MFSFGYVYFILFNLIFFSFSYNVNVNSFYIKTFLYDKNLYSTNAIEGIEGIEDIEDVVKDIEGIWLDLSINKFHITTFFILFYFLFFFIFAFKKPKYFIRSWNVLIFGFIDDFLSNTIIQQLGVKRGQKYSVLLKTFFFLILFSNLFGLIPFSFTITSHLIYTFSLSLSILIGITILGFYIQGISFLKLLVPGGAPKFLLPLLIPIEFISYIARCFSLAIRLFANMMSGHTLLNILSSFVIKININGFLLFSLAPLLVVIAVFLLEVGIAFLQAYVFLVLVCIYLKDAFEAGH
jgi:ATP synthase subunit 6